MHNFKSFIYEFLDIKIIPTNISKRFKKEKKYHLLDKTENTEKINKPKKPVLKKLKNIFKINNNEQKYNTIDQKSIVEIKTLPNNIQKEVKNGNILLNDQMENTEETNVPGKPALKKMKNLRKLNNEQQHSQLGQKVKFRILHEKIGQTFKTTSKLNDS